MHRDEVRVARPGRARAGGEDPVRARHSRTPGETGYHPPPRMPRATRAAAPRPDEPLGLRRQGAQRRTGRPRGRGRPRAAGVRKGLRRPLPDPPHAGDGRVRRQRRRRDGRRQHLRLQLPAGHRRPGAAVPPLLGRRHRHQPGREPVRRRPRHQPSPERPHLPRPRPPPPRDDHPGRGRHPGLQGDRLVLGRPLEPPDYQHFSEEGG